MYRHGSLLFRFRKALHSHCKYFAVPLHTLYSPTVYALQTHCIRYAASLHKDVRIVAELLPNYYVLITVEFRSNAQAGGPEYIGYLPLLFGRNQTVAPAAVIEIPFARETADDAGAYGGSLFHGQLVEEGSHAFGITHGLARAVKGAGIPVGGLL